MELKLKICGITNLEDARYCAAAGADFLGFIQYPDSPRFVDPSLAKDVIEWVYGPKAVGVFVNDTADTVNRIAEEAGFDLVQLHGEEAPETCAAIERPVIKALRIKSHDTTDTLRRTMERYAPHVSYFLLDTHHAAQYGGTGVPFDWKVAGELAETYPLFLAGGIGADNVGRAVRTVRPLGIDLSSSVEEEPGRKDFEKLDAFFDVFNDLRASLAEEA